MIEHIELFEHDDYSPEAEKHERPIPYEHSERATGDIRDSRELATILAALRYWQRNVEQGNAGTDDEFEPIASDDGALVPLTPGDIDALCARLSREG